MTNTSAGVEPVTQIGDVSTQIGDPYNPQAMSHYEAPKDDTKITVEKLLGYEEGYRGQPYHCSEGYVTYGIGHRLSSVKGVSLDDYSDYWISSKDAERLLSQDLHKVHYNIRKSSFVSAYDKLSKDRQIIIESMVYQMGIVGVAKFKIMWRDIRASDFAGAGAEMMDSKWAKQTPNRSIRHADVMRDGDLTKVYGAYIS